MAVDEIGVDEPGRYPSSEGVKEIIIKACVNYAQHKMRLITARKN